MMYKEVICVYENQKGHAMGKIQRFEMLLPGVPKITIFR